MRVPGSNATAYIAMIPVSLEAARRRSAIRKQQESQKAYYRQEVEALTIRDLSQLYYLNLEIEKQKQRLLELESDAFNISPQLTGMPSGSNVNDKVGTYAAEIADLKELISLNIQKCWYERNRLERYIQKIDDSQIRQIMTLRFVDGLRWEQVADELKGVTSESVKKQCYRYLRRH